MFAALYGKWLFMNDTNRSLLIAVIACAAMFFFAKSTQMSDGKNWITWVFAVSTLGLSVRGFWTGIRGARQLKTPWSWLAPGMNAFIFITFAAFSVLLLWVLQKK